jgi:hypothetical protein
MAQGGFASAAVPAFFQVRFHASAPFEKVGAARIYHG